MDLKSKLLLAFVLSLPITAFSITPLDKAEDISPSSVTETHDLMESLTIAANDGDVEAELKLGRQYEVTYMDAENALKWYTIAANKGHADAQWYLGQLYGSGKLGKEMPVEAFKWYLKSAQAGNPKGISTVAGNYFIGAGTPRNYLESYAWYSVDAVIGHNKNLAREIMDELEEKLGPDHIIRAQNRAVELLNSIENQGG